MLGLPLPELLAILLILGIIIVNIVYLLFLRRVFLGCKEENRTTSPNIVFLLLIPLVGGIYHFVIVLDIAKSLKAELDSLNITTESMPGQTIGLSMCAFRILAYLPHFGLFFAIISLFCWIFYWTKINSYYSQIKP